MSRLGVSQVQVAVGEVSGCPSSVLCSVKSRHLLKSLRRITDIVKPLPVEDHRAVRNAPRSVAAFETIDVAGSEDPIKSPMMFDPMVGNKV